ncbi:hypothetical protein EDB83DRAFT_2319016 [Lactarius deliciosus]|nr:hypothetical protein EDB83DRAFT_2319016 [Lactarius deliciosus]
MGRRACVHPPSREWGRAGGGVPSRAPFLRVRGGVPTYNTFRVNGEGWGRGWRALAFPVRAWRRSQGGRVDPGGRVPSHAPFLCEWGGAKREGEGDAERQGGVPSCAPLPCEWGREGLGGRVPSRAPFPRVLPSICTNGAARRGKGRGRLGVVGWSALARLLSTRTGLRGGAGRGGVSLCDPLAREWGREGPGIACSRVPPFRAYGVARPRGRGGAEGDGERGRRALCAPLPRKWGRKWPGVAGLRMPPYRTYGAACPRAPPFCANGERWGRGWHAFACPLSARTGQHGQGKGEAEGDGERGWRPSCALPGEWGREGLGQRALVPPFPHEQHETAKGEGVGLGAACPRAHPFRANGIEREGQRCPVLVHTFCANGQRGRETGGGEEMGRGTACPRVPPFRADAAARTRGKTGEGTLFAHPTPDSVWGGEGMVGKVGEARQTLWRKQRACHISADAPFPRITHREGHMRIRGTQCPPPLGLLGSPFSPICAATFAQKGGTRGHAAAAVPLSPARRTPFMRKAGARGHVAPPLPSWSCHPVRAEWGRARALRPTTPSLPRPFPLRTAPFAQIEGKTRGKGACEGTRPPGPSLPHSRRRGAHDGTPPRLSASPSPSLFAPPHSHGKGACEGTRPPGSTLPPWPRRHARVGNARARHPRPHPSPFTRKVLYAGTPPRTRGKGAREGMPPPALPHLREGGCTRARRPIRT